MADVFLPGVREITIPEFAKILKQRTEMKADAVLIVDGMPGCGKTTLQILVSWEIDKPNFSIKRNVVFDPNPMTTKEVITNLPPGTPVCLDEGMRLANARRAMTGTNMFLGEYFSINRKDFKIIFICAPSIQQIDTSIRNQRAIFWVHVIKRGVALIFRRSLVPADGDPFGIGDKGNAIKKVLRKEYPNRRMIELSTEEMVRALAKNMDNFAFVMRFPAMPAALEAEYEAMALKMRKELKMPVDYGVRVQHYRFVIQSMVKDLYETYELTQKEIADKYGLNVSTVNQMINKSGSWKMEPK